MCDPNSSSSSSSGRGEQDLHKSAATDETHSLACAQQQWIQEQNLLRRRLILQDNFSWSIPLPGSQSTLRYVGGLDVSFSKDEPSLACAALVVIDLHCNLHVVYEDYTFAHLHVPYIPGFLAFREASLLMRLLQDMKNRRHPFYPQLVMVDGNGVLHPKGFGLACHVGVGADLPTIGIGKNLYHVDGLNQVGLRQLLEDKENARKDFVILKGDSGLILGAHFKSCTTVFLSLERGR